MKRDIGLWSATAIGVGAIIGAGIFVPAFGLLSCLGLLVFLKLDGWLVGVIGIGLGTVYYRTFHRH